MSRPNGQVQVSAGTVQGLCAAVAAAVGLPEGSVPGPQLPTDALALLARRHRVGALLAVSRTTWTMQALRRLALLREILEELDAQGIPAVVLKGVGLAQEAYGDVGRREARDIDLLVAPDDASRACAVLEELGLRPTALPPWLAPQGVAGIVGTAHGRRVLPEVQLAGRGEIVELRWRLAHNAHLLPTGPDLLARRETIATADVALPVLPMPERWWYLHVHGTGHDWRRLLWVADVAALVRRRPELVAPDALAAAERAGVDRCVAAGLGVADACFPALLGEHARRWSQATRPRRLLVARALRMLAEDDPEAADVSVLGRARWVRARLAIRGEMAYKREEARQVLVNAARAHGEAEPGWRALAAGPYRWLRRRAERGDSSG